MSEIAKALLGLNRALLVGWVAPSALTVGLFVLLVLPAVDETAPFADLADAPFAEQGLVYLGATAAIAVALSALQTPLYRVLEGYLLWRPAWRDKARTGQIELRDELEDRVPDETEELTVEEALALERSRRFPTSEKAFAPTRLGNGIRRLEQYGEDRYQLDTQLLWYHLRTLVPESLSKNVDEARANVDFFVCSVYLLVVLAAAAGSASFGAPPGERAAAVATALLAPLAAHGAYRAAVAATDAWAAAVRAVVDLGRQPLAEALGLELPATLEQERAMWRRVGWLVGFRHAPEAGVELDGYRKRSQDERPKDDRRCACCLPGCLHRRRRRHA